MTNSEWLRTLSDETLARLISDDWCERVNCDRMVCDGDCERRVLAWLKKERRADYLSLAQELRHDYDDPLILEAAEAIEELTAALTASNEVIAKSRDKWISVKERLPEVNVSVLAIAKFKECGGYRIEISSWSGVTNHGVPHFWEFGDAMEVTHWMPLPELPKEVEE